MERVDVSSSMNTACCFCMVSASILFVSLAYIFDDLNHQARSTGVILPLSSCDAFHILLLLVWSAVILLLHGIPFTNVTATLPWSQRAKAIVSFRVDAMTSLWRHFMSIIFAEDVMSLRVSFRFYSLFSGELSKELWPKSNHTCMANHGSLVTPTIGCVLGRGGRISLNCCASSRK